MIPSHRLRLLLPLGVMVLALAACGDDGGTTPSSSSVPPNGDGASSPTGAPCAVAEEHEVTIVAKDLAWSTDCIQAPEGVALTVVIDNRDAEINHNLHVTGLPGSPKTKLQGGPITQRLDLGADLAAGEYAFVCDLHPNMTGTLEVLDPLAEGPVTSTTAVP